MNTETWTTRTVAVETPKGIRYQGFTIVGEGRPTYGPLPRNAQVRFQTRLFRFQGNASDQARSRTIHHNLWHNGDASGHSSRDCHER